MSKNYSTIVFAEVSLFIEPMNKMVILCLEMLTVLYSMAESSKHFT